MAVIDRIERRVLELEDTAGTPSSNGATTSAADVSRNGGDHARLPDADHAQANGQVIASLLVKGRSLLAANQPAVRDFEMTSGILMLDARFPFVAAHNISACFLGDLGQLALAFSGQFGG